MTLTVQTGGVAYNLNTSAIDTAALASAFPRADMSRVPFDVTIKNSAATVEGETLVLSRWNLPSPRPMTRKNRRRGHLQRLYRPRDRGHGGAGGKNHHGSGVERRRQRSPCAHRRRGKGRKYYAVVNSLTNSTYALIKRSALRRCRGQMYEATVNEMGGRKIIAGRGAAVFDGEAGITRAEFAAILVRALGLPADGTSTFSDVPAAAWHTGAVATAVRYGLTDGRGDNRFEPDAAITRQEAMLMLQRAAALTGFTGTDGSLDIFTDADSVGPWAQEAAEWNVGSGLFQGADGKLSPTADITRAEGAASFSGCCKRQSLWMCGARRRLGSGLQA